MVAPAGRPDDPGGFSCTPDSVSVSQMFGIRTDSRPLPALRVPAAPAAPSSPGLSTADPFADDDLMDADLLDACEAAEATPAAADLPNVSAERSKSRGVTNGGKAGSRDILDDIAVESCGVPSGVAAVKTPSRDASDSVHVSNRDAPITGVFSGPGSRDTPITGVFSGPGSRDTPSTGVFSGPGSRDTVSPGVFSGPGSRDTPSSSRRNAKGSHVSGRRSAGSAVKRRFPGPAGILPITVSDSLESGYDLWLERCRK